MRWTQRSDLQFHCVRRPAAFTLVELLVVIAIIAVLAALLLPALQGAKDSAKTAKCISNVKQLVLGCLLYADDWDGQLPSLYANNLSGPTKYIWYEAIGPYLSYGILPGTYTPIRCPAEKKPPMTSTYAANDYVFGNFSTSTGVLLSQKLNQVPVTTMLIADNDGYQGSPTGNGIAILNPTGGHHFTLDNDGDGLLDSYPFHLYNNVCFRHHGMAVIGCADGSARAISVKQWVSQTYKPVPPSGEYWNNEGLWGNGLP